MPLQWTFDTAILFWLALWLYKRNISYGIEGRLRAKSWETKYHPPSIFKQDSALFELDWIYQRYHLWDSLKQMRGSVKEKMSLKELVSFVEARSQGNDIFFYWEAVSRYGATANASASLPSIQHWVISTIHSLAIYSLPLLGRPVFFIITLGMKKLRLSKSK